MRFKFLFTLDLEERKRSWILNAKFLENRAHWIKKINEYRKQMN